MSEWSPIAFTEEQKRLIVEQGFGTADANGNVGFNRIQDMYAWQGYCIDHGLKPYDKK